MKDRGCGCSQRRCRWVQQARHDDDENTNSMTSSTNKDIITVVKAADVGGDAGYTEGMKRSGALVGCSDKMCSLVMDAEPNSSSAIHHHGEQDTIVYALSGKGTIAFGPDPSQRREILPGDHALIPAFAEHQEINTSDEPVRWIIIRSGSKPVTENIAGWGATKK